MNQMNLLKGFSKKKRKKNILKKRIDLLTSRQESEITFPLTQRPEIQSEICVDPPLRRTTSRILSTTTEFSNNELDITSFKDEEIEEEDFLKENESEVPKVEEAQWIQERKSDYDGLGYLVVPKSPLK